MRVDVALRMVTRAGKTSLVGDGWVEHVDASSDRYFTIFSGQPGERGVRVETARIGDDPQRHSAERLWLRSNRCRRPGEAGPIRRDAKHRDYPRINPSHPSLQGLGARQQLFRVELIGSRRSDGNQIRDAHAPRDQMGAVGLGEPACRVDLTIHDASAIKRGIEAVSAPGEVRLDGNRLQPGIDADDQQSRIRAE